MVFMHAEISEDEAEDRLQDAIQEKFAIFGDVCASSENKYYFTFWIWVVAFNYDTSTTRTSTLFTK